MNTAVNWTGRSVVVAAKDQVFCDLAGDTAILNLTSGIYYSLNRVGSQIWNIIQEPATIDDIRRMVLYEYEVQSSQCESDLFALLEDLAEAGLVQVQREPPE